jgi:hypothetical protein
MYANLSVKYRDSNGDVQSVYAWLVESNGGALVICIDGNDGQGSHPIDAEAIEIGPQDLIQIVADF